MSTSLNGHEAAHSNFSLLRNYRVSIAVTLIIWGAVAYFGGGLQALYLVVVLTALEVTFSFDNAVVNSKYLKTMSPFWQMIFLTVGIIIAVFAVRFLLPILIVMATAGLGFVDVVNLAFNDPKLYAEELHKAAPVINSFGGTFLGMIGVAYFLDHEKDSHWLHRLESKLAPLGRLDNITVFLAMAVTLVIYLLNGGDTTVLFAAFAGIFLHVSLDLFNAVFEPEGDDEESSSSMTVQHKTGMAAFVVFMQLEILDASFSFDGVIGAFAVTSDVLIIMAGLGAGAVWVRSMTVHLVRADTLAEYRYLEHGAHWAILALGITMLIALFHVELPSWVVGSIGLVFIAFALLGSRRANQRDASLEEHVVG